MTCRSCADRMTPGSEMGPGALLPESPGAPEGARSQLTSFFWAAKGLRPSHF